MIDLSETTSIDSTALGLLAQISIQSKRVLEHKPNLLVSSDDIMRVTKGMSFDIIFNILQETIPLSGDFKVIEPVDVGEKDMINRILSAHRTLMSLSDENREKVENVIKILEEQAQPRSGHK